MDLAPAIELIAPPAAAPAGPVVVGYSGGLDSTVLLHLLAATSPIRASGLRAVHVHHGLHRDADAWADHCASVCAGLGVELHVARVTVTRESGRGPEAAAREARHAGFRDALNDGDTLALAHHRDDQAETFLLRALRGSGDGLAAMATWSRFDPGWRWRPLLRTPCALLLDHARAHCLAWIEDPSNADDDLDRNYLRNRVMPLLRERWVHADAALARSASLASDMRGLLDAEDGERLDGVRGTNARELVVAALLQMPAPRRARVLRRWIDTLQLPPIPATGIAAIETALLAARDDASAEFRWGDAIVRRWRDLLYADRVRAPLPSNLGIAWDGSAPVRLPGGDTLALVDASGPPAGVGFDHPVDIRARRGGERIVLPGRAHSHALKNVLQDHLVPPWVRDRLPLLVDRDGALLAAGDGICSASFDAWLRERSLRMKWTDAGTDL